MNSMKHAREEISSGRLLSTTLAQATVADKPSPLAGYLIVYNYNPCVARPPLLAILAWFDPYWVHRLQGNSVFARRADTRGQLPQKSSVDSNAPEERCSQRGWQGGQD